MTAIGVMTMPENFKYAGVFRKGRPQHDFYDAFRIRHPRMAAGKRAKIFSSFDALKGFSEAICSKEVLYMDRIELDQETLDELGRRLTVLHALTPNGRLARKHRVPVEVTFFEPCADEHSEAWGYLGRYRTIRGICLRVDPHTICVDGISIALADILRLENPSGIFDRDDVRTDPG